MSVTVTQTASQPKLEFEVVVRVGRGETRHTVTMESATLARLAGDRDPRPEDFIGAVFAFLLEREPKESILSRFDVTVVSRYFPELETEIGAYLDRGATR